MKRRLRVTIPLLAFLAGCGIPGGFQGTRPAADGFLARSAGGALPPPDVVWVPSPNFNDRPDGMHADAVVWHHTAGRSDAMATARYFQNPASRVSSHYIVDRTGYVVRCVPDDKRAWHAGRSEFQGKPDVNGFSLGIEISNVGDNLDPYPNAQVEAVIRLTAYLCQTNAIGLDRITRHRDVALPAGRKYDTSDNYPLEHAREGVRALLAGEPPPPRPEPARPPGYDPRVRHYLTRPGDTWASVADEVLDNPLRADEIRELNPGHSALRPGLRLRIPTDYDLFFRRHGLLLAPDA